VRDLVESKSWKICAEGRIVREGRTVRILNFPFELLQYDFHSETYLSLVICFCWARIPRIYLFFVIRSCWVTIPKIYLSFVICYCRARIPKNFKSHVP
jgi:hypothetical protein